jgi:hypothetical protein
MRNGQGCTQEAVVKGRNGTLVVAGLLSHAGQNGKQATEHLLGPCLAVSGALSPYFPGISTRKSRLAGPGCWPLNKKQSFSCIFGCSSLQDPRTLHQHAAEPKEPVICQQLLAI